MNTQHNQVYVNYYEFILFNFFDSIKKKHNHILLNIINDFIENSSIYQMKIINVSNLYMIYTTKLSINLHHNNKLIDDVIHHIDYFIFDDNLTIITSIPKLYNISLNKLDQDYLIHNWYELDFHNYYVGTHVIFIKHNNDIYVSKKYSLDLLKNNQYINNLFNINQDISTYLLNNNDYAHIIIHSQKLKFLLSYSNSQLIDNKITIIEKNKLNCDNKIYFTCKDELDFYIDELNTSNIMHKKLTYGGVIIKYRIGEYYFYSKILTPIYNKLIDLIKPNNNLTACYLELYKNDNLNFMINWMSLYPTDVIKRVNTSFKTLSKELLNIYHLTRKKSHCELYNLLDKEYKKILYDLHTKFINSRKHEYYSDDILGEKKSIDQEQVYKYLKHIPIDNLINLYNERIKLIENIKKININNYTQINTNSSINNIYINPISKVMLDDCIYTKTISHLLQICH